jgi:hypothetical protein
MPSVRSRAVGGTRKEGRIEVSGGLDAR